MSETNEQNLETLLKEKQFEYNSDVSKNTSKEEILTLVEALKFCENNYTHNNKGVREYIGGNLSTFDRNNESLLEIYDDVEEAVENDTRLHNFGLADLLTRSILEYMKNGTPKNAQTETTLRSIIDPLISKK